MIPLGPKTVFLPEFSLFCGEKLAFFIVLLLPEGNSYTEDDREKNPGDSTYDQLRFQVRTQFVLLPQCSKLGPTWNVALFLYSFAPYKRELKVKDARGKASTKT